MTIRLFNCDCLEAMRQMPDKAYDLAIVDPPYTDDFSKLVHSRERNIENATKRLAGYSNVKRWKGMSDKPSQEYFKELMRVSINQIIWGGNYFVNHLYPSSAWLVWDKVQYSRFADCELAWTSFDTAVRKFTFQWSGMLQENMVTKQIRIHPTEKPIALYEWLLKNYAKPGDKILDTHGGSMSSAIACYNLGFDLDIYELDPDYFKAASQRLEEHMKKGRLFEKPGELIINKGLFDEEATACPA